MNYERLDSLVAGMAGVSARNFGLLSRIWTRLPNGTRMRRALSRGEWITHGLDAWVGRPLGRTLVGLAFIGISACSPVPMIPHVPAPSVPVAATEESSVSAAANVAATEARPAPGAATVSPSATAFPTVPTASRVPTLASNSTLVPGTVLKPRSASDKLYGDIVEFTLKLGSVSPIDRFGSNVRANLTSPTGALHRIQGFYDGEAWKVRFWPDELGHWSYTYDVQIAKDSWQRTGDGSFDAIGGSTDSPLQPNPENPFRWIMASGAPFFPLGLQDCLKAHGDQLPNGYIDGGPRAEGQSRVVSLDEYFRIYGEAGFNLLRFSPNNCSFSIFDSYDTYRWPEMRATDQILALAHKHGFHVMFGIFGTFGAVTTKDEKTLQKQERFIAYVIARWGAYVDFWELLNETETTDAWITRMAGFIHAVDPDHGPVSMSPEKPRLPAIDVVAPHWYETEPDWASDLRIQEQAKTWKAFGKPVIFGEQGNTGRNWDPTSAQRMRVRTWTSLFDEIALVFWNTSYGKDGPEQGVSNAGGTANIYLGPEERQYTRVLQDLSSWLDARVRMTPVRVSDPAIVRAYGLASDAVAAVYLHHYPDHNTAARGITLQLDLSSFSNANGPLVGQWIDPATGNLLALVPLQVGRQTVPVPEFKVDLALLVTGSR